MEIKEKDKQRFWAKVEKSTYCWYWKGAVANNGYGNFWVNKKYEKAHRFSYLLKHGNLPKKHAAYVCHICDVPVCVNPDHLWLGTPKQNQDDMRKKGRDYCIGVPKNLHGAKLTLQQAKEIFDSPKAQKDLAQEYKVSRPAICRIKKGKAFTQIHG